MNKLKSILSSRKWKYGSTAVVIMTATIAIFVVVNLLASLVPWQWDLTPEGLYSIGDQTTEVLEGLEKEVTIYGLFDPTKVDSDSEYSAVMELLEKYGSYENITVEYVDPNKNVGFISKLDPDQILNIGLRDFVVVGENDTKRVIKYYDMFVSMASEYSSFGTTDVGSKAEMAFTSAIYYVTRDEAPKIYLTSGHGEYDFEDNGFITIGEVISVNGFDYGRIDLQLTESIPGDASMIMIANPSSDFAREEIEKLRDFMYEGKSVIVLLDSADTGERYENLQSFLSDYNLAYGYDKMRELDDDYHLIGNQYRIFPNLYEKTLLNNPIKDVFSKMLADNVRSVRVLRKSNDALEIDPLLITSETAVAEALTEEDRTEKGAKYIGVAVKDNRTEAKIVALGSAYFVQDQTLYNYKQYEESAVRFLMNSLKWLEGDVDEIFIETKDYFINLIDVTAGQIKTVSTLTIYVMPGLILLIGLAVYLKRRNL